MNKLKNFYIIIPIITALFSLGMLLYTASSKDYNFVSYSNFLNDLNDGNISKVILNDNSKIIVTLKNNTVYETDNPGTYDFKENLLLQNITVTDYTEPPLLKTLPSGLLVLSIIVIAAMLMTKSRGTSSAVSMEYIDFSKKKNKILGFDSVAGNEEAKNSLSDIVDFLKNPSKYSKYGARMPKGVILYGDPGTGKTLLAKAVAGEADVPFYALSGSDFVQVYVGVGAARVRNLFKKAKSHGKAVIFIDEIDAIGKRRSSSIGGNDNSERDQTLNALLTEMSGFNEEDGIVVIAATNRLDMLDPALLRPGRFDRHVEVALPDINAREKIIKLHLKNKPYENFNIKDLAKKTAYFSGAKLENLINEAAILAAKQNSHIIMKKHIDEAYTIVLTGHEKIERNHFKESDKLLTSYHEAGHTLASMILLPNETISKVSIIPTTRGAGGYTLSIPEDTNYARIDYLQNKIKVLLGGRAAEEIVFGKNKISTGAQSDLSHSTDIIIKMITEYGMGNSLGLINLNGTGSFKESYGGIVIEECKNAIGNLYKETYSLLLENRHKLNKIALDLLNKETLYEDDLIDIAHNA